MLQVAVEEVEDGLHPHEVIATIRTADGAIEEVPVDRRLVQGKQMTAYAVTAERDRILIELPNETARGFWRVWMPRSSVSVREDAAA